MSSSNTATMTIEVPKRTMKLCAEKLPEGVTMLLVAPQDLAPEFIRLPDGEERCPVTGMSKTWLIERIQDSRGTDHEIRTHHIRAKGRTRGTVLIARQSLIDYIAAFPAPPWADEGEASTEEGEG